MIWIAPKQAEIENSTMAMRVSTLNVRFDVSWFDSYWFNPQTEFNYWICFCAGAGLRMLETAQHQMDCQCVSFKNHRPVRWVQPCQCIFACRHIQRRHDMVPRFRAAGVL